MSTGTQSSPLPQNSDVPCSDESWAVTPQHWQEINVDKSMAEWWKNDVTPTEKGSNTFVGLLFNISGDGIVQCGIGSDSTCTLPSCQRIFPYAVVVFSYLTLLRLDFLEIGLPKWVYFAQVSVVEMSKLFNNIDVSLPLIPVMAW